MTKNVSNLNPIDNKKLENIFKEKLFIKYTKKTLQRQKLNKTCLSLLSRACTPKSIFENHFHSLNVFIANIKLGIEPQVFMFVRSIQIEYRQKCVLKFCYFLFIGNTSLFTVSIDGKNRALSTSSINTKRYIKN